jgi:hypothetical protein
MLADPRTFYIRFDSPATSRCHAKPLIDKNPNLAFPEEAHKRAAAVLKASKLLMKNSCATSK